MSIFTKILNGAVDLYKNVSGGAKLTQVLGSIYSNLDEIIISIVTVAGANTETLVREAWQEFRNKTGTDLGALDVFRDIPPEVEEKMFNGLADFGEEMTLYFIGHYTNGVKPSETEFRAVMKSIPFGDMLKPADSDEAKAVEKPAPAPDLTTTSAFDLGLSATLRTMERNPETLGLDLKIKTLTKAIIQLGHVND